MAPHLGHVIVQQRIADMQRDAERSRLVRSAREGPADTRRATRIERVAARLGALRPHRPHRPAAER